MSKQDIEKRLGFAAQGVKTEMAAHPSWSEGILGKDTDPKLAAYSWISKNNIESGRKQMLLADIAAGMYEKNPSMSIAQAVLAAAKDMVSKGVATRDIQQWAENGGKFSRPGAKAKMGFLSRVGYAATALTADPADPKSPEYRKQVSEAKAAAKDAITNYKFMRDKVKERLAALDAYVTNAIKVINSATSAKDIEHYVEQLRIAVKSQSMILGASKSPFSRAGAKAKFGLSPSEMKENQRRIETNIRYEAGVIRDVSSNMRFIKDEIQRLTAEIKNTRDIKRKAQLSLKLDAENKKMKDQVAYLRRARQMIQENQADAKSLGITLDAKWAGNFARPGVKAKA